MSTELLDPAAAPREFVHAKCGATSRMSDEMVTGYLADPHRFNDWAFCSKCDGFVPHHECRWAGTDEPLDAYFARLKAAVPAPPPADWLGYAAAPIVVIAGALIGYAAGGGYGCEFGLIIGFVVALLLLIARLLGLR
jgi:hypothetical protein